MSMGIRSCIIYTSICINSRIQRGTLQMAGNAGGLKIWYLNKNTQVGYLLALK